MSWIKYRIGLVLLTTVLLASCKSVKYSMSGINIPPDVKTVSVQLFDNKAALINPLLAQVYTEKLKDKFIRQTPLRLVTENGDWQFQGFITQYEVAPVNRQTISGGTRNKLTIGIKVKYTNTKNEKESFDRDFNRFQDYDASENFSNIESTLVDQITDVLVQDVFNETALKW